MSLRDQLAKYMGKDPSSRVQSIKSAGVNLSAEEEAEISQGKLDQFSDEQLEKRFNRKVLGSLGISAEGQEGSAGSSGSSSSQSKME